MSPDPSGLVYADPTNPQSLNLYSYALNNPLAFLDPSGLTACFYGGKGDTIENDHDPTDYEDVPDQQTCADNGGSVIQNTTFVDVQADTNDSDITTTTVEVFDTISYKACPSSEFKITGIAPNQAPGPGEFTPSKRSPKNGEVAISPANFGVPYATIAQRSAAQRGVVSAVLHNIIIFPEFNTNTAPLPKNVPNTPFGAPSGPYSPAGVIGPLTSSNAIDVYRYPTNQTANASTRVTTPAIFVPNNSVGVGCPQ